jgi:hypothetical protein
LEFERSGHLEWRAAETSLAAATLAQRERLPDELLMRVLRHVLEELV